MNAKEFVGGIEAYYGKYPTSYQRDSVEAHIRKIPENELEATLRTIFEVYTSQYKTVPDIAKIREIREEYGNEIKKASGGIWNDGTGRLFVGDKRIGRMDGRTFVPWIGSDLLTSEQRMYLVIEEPKGVEEYVDFLKRHGVALEAQKVLQIG